MKRLRRFIRTIQKKFLKFIKKYPERLGGKALLETPVIIIGIFLAFQLNQFVEENKARSEELKLVQRLMHDLEGDSMRLKNLINRYDSSIQINRMIRKALEVKNMETLSLHLFEGFSNIDQLNARTTTYDEMISSGKIHNFKNDSLVNRIVEYYRRIDRENYYVQRREQMIRQSELDPALLPFRKLRNKQVEEEEILPTDRQWLLEEGEGYNAFLNLLLISHRQNRASISAFSRV